MKWQTNRGKVDNEAEEGSSWVGSVWVLIFFYFNCWYLELYKKEIANWIYLKKKKET